MPKNTSAAQDTHLAGSVVRPIHLAELEFSTTLRYTNAPFSVFYDSDGDTVEEEFLGVGALGRVSKVEQSVESRADRITLQITGLEPATIAVARGQDYQGKAGRLWTAWMDEDYVLIGDPVPIFIGIMDVMPYRIQEGFATIEVTLVNRFVKWEKAPDSPRYSDEDHQHRFPADTFFSRVPEISVGKEVLWGRV